MTNKNHESGNFHVAKYWVESSSLPKATKKALLLFLNRFPSLTFYQENETFLNQLEKNENVKLPQWFRDIRQTVAYVMPNQRVEIKFGNFDDVDIEDIFNESWYMIDLGYIDAQRELLQNMEDLRPFPIGGSLDNVGSMLTINLADVKDQQVYEYNTESLWDNIDEGQPLSSAFSEVFDSYAEMFKHIIAVKVYNGDKGKIIQAQK